MLLRPGLVPGFLFGLPWHARWAHPKLEDAPQARPRAGLSFWSAPACSMSPSQAWRCSSVSKVLMVFRWASSVELSTFALTAERSREADIRARRSNVAEVPEADHPVEKLGTSPRCRSNAERRSNGSQRPLSCRPSWWAARRTCRNECLAPSPERPLAFRGPLDRWHRASHP